MSKTKPKIDTKIKNYYLEIDKDLVKQSPNPNFDLHGISLPFRICICAPSGSGKSNFVFHLLKLFCFGKGTFASITIVTQNSSEPLYDQLRRSCDGINIVEGMQNIPDLDEFDKDFEHLVIFDDLVLKKKQEQIEEYYMRARKLHVSVMYLTQKYFRTPSMIRLNADFTVILRLDGARDAKLVLSDFGGGLTKKQLEDMYQYAVAEKFSCLFIDKAQPLSSRFRKGVDEIINPDDFK